MIQTYETKQLKGVNVWPNSAGELAVRPGLRELHTPGATSRWAGAATFVHPNVDEIEYLYLRVSDISTTKRMIPKNSSHLGERSTDLIGVEHTTPHLWWAQMEREIMVAGHAFPPRWGMVGGHWPDKVAPKADSINPRRTTISLPIGPIINWADRMVYVDGDTIRYSDPTEPRAIIGDNFDNGPWQGRIHDLHVSQDSSLIVVAEDGIYRQPAGAAATEVVSPAWEKLTDYASPGPKKTCLSQGVIWGLVPQGIRQLYPPGPTIRPTLPTGPLRRHAIPGLADYSICTLHSSDDGPVISVDGILWRLHVASGFSSWWILASASDPGNFLTIARGQYGRELFVWEQTSRMLFGNFDGGAALETGEDSTLVGSLVGSLPTTPAMSPRVRGIQFSTDGTGPGYAYVRGRGLSAGKTSNAEPGSFVIGTDTWGAETKTFLTRPLRSREYQFSIRTDDIFVQLSATHSRTRFGNSMNLRLSGPGRTRSSR